MPTPSMEQFLGRVCRSPDSQVLSIPFGSEYVVLIKRVHLASLGSCWARVSVFAVYYGL